MKSLNTIKALHTALLSGVLVFAFAGCDRHEGPAEQAGKSIDKAADQVGEKVEKAGEDIQDAAKGKK